MSSKRWYASKTLWLNAVIAGMVALEASWGLVQPLLSVNFHSAIAVVLPVLNAVLRVLGSKGGQ